MRVLLATGLALSTTFLAAGEASRFADLDFQIEKPFVVEHGRADGARVFNTRSGTSLVARLFFAEGKPAKLWAATNATPSADDECTDLHVRGGKQVSGRVWHEVSFRRLDERGWVQIITSVTDCGPFLVAILLVGPVDDVAGKRWALERAQSRIAFGQLADMDARDWRLAEATDVVGDWSMIALETAGVPRGGSPLLFPHQRLEVAAGGELRHLAHTSELTAEVRAQFRTSGARLHWSITTPGLFSIRRRDADTRHDEHVALILEPREKLLKDPESATRSGDLLLFVRTPSDQPALARLLRREESPYAARATAEGDAKAANVDS